MPRTGSIVTLVEKTEQIATVTWSGIASIWPMTSMVVISSPPGARMSKMPLSESVTLMKCARNPPAAKLAAGVNGGAAAGGALVAMQPELLGFDSRLVAGAGFMAVGAFFLKGDAAAITVCACAGMVAGWTQDYVQTMVSATTSTDGGATT